jgi:hypothetical protein
MWVAGGTGTNTLAYSADGINWTASPSPFISQHCLTVAWDGSLWIAGGISDTSTGQISYSYDGINWQDGSSPFITIATSVAWNGSIWVAGGYGDDSGTITTIATSPDGTTWTASPSTVVSHQVNSITWNGSLWYAANNNGTMASSPDGVVWTTIPSATTVLGSSNFTVCARRILPNLGKSELKQYVPLTVTNNFTIAGGQPSAYSYDGLTWYTSKDIYGSGTPGYVFCVAWNGILWVAGGYDTDGVGRLGYSSDGINWTNSTSGTALFTGGCFAAAWSGSMWVAGGKDVSGAAVMAYSSDGISWTVSSSGSSIFGEGGCKTIAWNGYMWVAGGYGTNQMAYSYDGITWNPSTSGNSVLTDNCYAVAWNGSLWVAGGDGTYHVCYSDDGINWTNSTTGTALITGGCLAVAWNGSLWVAGGYGGNVANSYDGILWTINPTASALSQGNYTAALASRTVLPNVGTDTFGGTKIFAGSGAPSVNTGRIGDFYIDMTTMTLYGPKINYGWDFGNCSGSYNTTSHIITMNLAWNAVPGAQSYKIFSGLQNFTFAPINQYPTGTGGDSTTGVLLSPLTGAVNTTHYTGLTYTYTTTNSSSDARVYLYLYAYSDGGATTRLTPFPGYCLNFFNGLSDGIASAGPAKLTLDYKQYDSIAGHALINNDSLNVIGSPNKHIYTKSITVVS